MKGLFDQDALMEAAQNAAAKAESMEFAAQDGADKPMSLRTRAGAFGCKVMGYAGIGMAGMSAFPQVAYAQSLDITNLNSILTMIGTAIAVVGIALAGWNLVQVGMSMKDNQGFQMDKNVWGIVGGVAMVVAGGAFNTAANSWTY